MLADIPECMRIIIKSADSRSKVMTKFTMFKLYNRANAHHGRESETYSLKMESEEDHANSKHHGYYFSSWPVSCLSVRKLFRCA